MRNVSPAPGLRRRLGLGLCYRENCLPEVPRQSVGRSAGRWVSQRLHRG
ncbi:hypothetical protein MC885_008910 [Smutsia gigantea]|nr:hypothetical protein MC885_008910 [Smutsia gigantea]